MSSGLSLARSRDVISILSIKISGDVSPLPKEVTLRTKNWASSSPGAPVVWYAIRPAILPESAVVKLLEGTFKSLVLTVVMDETTLSLLCFPKATTTASSSISECSDSLTLMILTVPTSILCVLKPINENTNVSPSFADSS